MASICFNEIDEAHPNMTIKVAAYDMKQWQYYITFNVNEPV